MTFARVCDKTREMTEESFRTEASSLLKPLYDRAAELGLENVTGRVPQPAQVNCLAFSDEFCEFPEVWSMQLRLDTLFDTIMKYLNETDLSGWNGIKMKGMCYSDEETFHIEIHLSLYVIPK